MFFTNNIAFAISPGLLALSCSCLLDLGLVRRNLCSLSGTRERFDRTKNWQTRFPFFSGAISSTNWTHVNIYIRAINSTRNLHSFFVLSFSHSLTKHSLLPRTILPWLSSSLFFPWKCTLRSSSKLSCVNNCTSIKACLVVHCVDNLAARALYHVITPVPYC